MHISKKMDSTEFLLLLPTYKKRIEKNGEKNVYAKERMWRVNYFSFMLN